MSRLAERWSGRAGRWVQRPRWLLACFAASAGLLAVYAAQVSFFAVHPGNAWGVSYGILATLLMLAALALALRRRGQRWVPGTAQAWTQLHVYGGSVFLLLVFLHAGFRWPQGVLTAWLWLLAVWVTVSGLVGVALAKTIPRILASGLRLEVLYERIPELVDEVREKAEALVAESSTPVRDFYRKLIAPELRRPRVRPLFFVDITGGIQQRLRDFAFLRRLLTAAEQQLFDELQELYRTKLELDAHFTLQKPLRFWLYSHVPAAIVLALLVLLHIVVVWLY